MVLATTGAAATATATASTAGRLDEHGDGVESEGASLAAYDDHVVAGAKTVERESGRGLRL